ncbi:tyrosine-type recombinase/integrase [Sulfurimonas paralvinellae]|uniref:Tyrosine-type recombinase/integrase n=1 Tax=Sulfurimonas paralvinellae TaxID=317658 RepID=A0A7M1B5X2_9BACT|nr:tyrosine-type recombinase/integrase [Sulfurimonas paralvinellae]QOP45127.1 tyrosine-type recombinase/integrase [Sulfurimonas paralvinellae]
MKKSIDKQITDFSVYLQKQRGYSELTIKSYRETLQEAFGFIEITDEKDHLLFNLMPYRIQIASLNAKTISKKLSAIRSFTAFINEQGSKVVLRGDESIKVAKTLPKPISHEHIMEALEKASLQEKLVVLMLYTLGLRISELSALKVEDIDDEWIRIIGKGNKQRDVPLLAEVKKLIDEYLSTFMIKKFLFEKNGERLSENSLRYMITKVFGRVALKVTPHQLRHSYASALLNSGAPIVDVSELLGHASMATTQIYTKLGSALKQQNYNKAHPLAQGEK